MGGESYSDKAYVNTKISILTQIIRLVIQLASVAVLARILNPADFGTMAMSMTVIVILMTFGNSGIATSVSQDIDTSEKDLSTLFYVSIFVGIVLSVFAWCVASYASILYKTPEVELAIKALSIAIFISTSTGVFKGILLRAGDWNELRKAAIYAQLCSLFAGTVSAYFFEVGVFALVISLTVLIAVESLFIVIRVSWRPLWYFNLSEIRGLLEITLNLTLFGLVNSLQKNVDNVLIGYHWGTHILGVYTRAFNVYMMPVGVLGGSIGSVLLPIMTQKTANESEWEAAVYRVFVVIAMLSGFVTVTVFSGSQFLVAALLGPGWGESEQLLRIFSIALFGSIIANTTGWIFLSTKRSKLMTRWGFGVSIAFSLMFLCTYQYGIFSITFGYLTLTLISLPLLLKFVAMGTTLKFKVLLEIVLFSSCIVVISILCTFLIFGFISESGGVYIEFFRMLVNAMVYLLFFLLVCQLTKRKGGVFQVYRDAIGRSLSIAGVNFDIG